MFVRYLKKCIQTNSGLRRNVFRTIRKHNLSVSPKRLL